MAIILLGKSECPLCGKTLEEGEEIIGLPAISDTSHPLLAYFDNGFHKACYENWEEKDKIDEALTKEKDVFERSVYYREMLSKYGKPK